MNDVTQILNAIQQGAPRAAEELLPLVYDELRKLAAQRMAQESAGQTLQATALVHEAYLRLVNIPASSSNPASREWDHRGHFFAAAAEAMRRILIEAARHKGRIKHGGEWNRVELPDSIEDYRGRSERLLELDAALGQLESEDPQSAQLVKLHFFGGLPLEEVGQLLGLSRASAYREWAYARSWLKAAMSDPSP